MTLCYKHHSTFFFFCYFTQIHSMGLKISLGFLFCFGGFSGSHTHIHMVWIFHALCDGSCQGSQVSPSFSLALSLSLRCSSEANELSLHMKPSSIIAYTHTLTHRFPCTRIEEQKQWGFNYILKVELLFTCNMMFPCWYVLHIVWNNKALWNKSVSLRATIYFLELRTIWLRWLVLLFV